MFREFRFFYSLHKIHCSNQFESLLDLAVLTSLRWWKLLSANSNKINFGETTLLELTVKLYSFGINSENFILLELTVKLYSFGIDSETNSELING